MACKRFRDFQTLLLMIVTHWIAGTSMKTFTKFQKLSDGRFTSELGTTNTYSVETCIYLCLQTPSCLSVSYEQVTQQCELGSNVPGIEQVTVDTDWVVYYKTVLSPSGTSTTGNFVLVELVMPWTEANNYCHRTYSGHLAHVKTEAVMNQLISLLDDRPYVMYAWVGATDSAGEGDWVWTDSTPVYDGYTRWQPSQPDDNLGNEDCLMLYNAAQNYTWNDINCLTLLVSICQY